MAANVEAQFIVSFLRAHKKTQTRVFSSIDKAWFFSRKDEIEYVFSFYDKFSRFPSEEAFLAKFPEFSVPAVSDTAEYYALELKSRSLYTVAKVGLNPILSDLQRGVTDGFSIAKALVGLASRLAVEEPACADAVDSNDERFLRYEAKTRKDVLAFSPPFGTLQRCLHRFVAGNLITLYARPSIGKTWISCLFALEAARQGLRTAIYSPEMTDDEIKDRLDGLAFNLPWTRFTRGVLTTEERIVYAAKALRERAMHDNLFVINKSAGLVDAAVLKGMVSDLKADVLIVDGVHQMPSVGSSMVERVYDSCRKMKYLIAQDAEHPVIVFQTVQEARPKPGVKTSDSAAWGDTYLQESDYFLRLSGIPTTCERVLEITKARNGMCGECRLAFCVDPKVSISENFSEDNYFEVDAEEEPPSGGENG